ncbi:AAA family ATPase [uncultured Parasutterella sp.]|uniref:AAA family ATPase n=1 Tax=uncultured Parasutterella sp. TaxID=1263098 RepID=UPI002591A63D|nr:AAA family ATPase [uncultured Parasutterella sp.]
MNTTTKQNSTQFTDTETFDPFDVDARFEIEARSTKSAVFYLNKFASEYEGEVKAFINAQRQHKTLFTLPFKQTSKGYEGQEYDFEFRPGELTVLGGSNGSGKSMLIGQIALHLINRGARPYIASFEMSPVRTLVRLCRQAMCTRIHSSVSADVAKRFLANVSENLVIFSQEQATNIHQLMEFLQSAVSDYGCNILFIDSLMMCVSNDMDKIETDALMQELVQFCREKNVHIVLVAHFRKLGGSADKPKYSVYDEADKDNIKGASGITNLAFNVITLAKNRKKAKDKAAMNEFDDSQPDHVLNICKQRNGSYEGYVNLWFDSISLNFCTSWERDASQYQHYLEGPDFHPTTISEEEKEF